MRSEDGPAARLCTHRVTHSRRHPMAPALKLPKEHPVVSHDEWIRARTEFLAREKEFTRQRDELSRARRELPWERVEKTYVFDGPDGKASLADLFAGKSQLVVYQFMFNPEAEEGCKHCSFW